MAVESFQSNNGKELTIVPGEKFDFSMVQDFKDAYSGDLTGVSKIVVDLRQTEYMDSSALGMLLNMQKSLQGSISDFEITNSRPQVAKILEISRFDKKFTIK